MSSPSSWVTALRNSLFPRVRTYAQYIVSCKVSKGTSEFILHGVYFPPLKVAELWDKLSDWLGQERHLPQIIIGDVNPGRKGDTFSGLENLTRDTYIRVLN